MSILVGTASWTDKTLIACGRFYPKNCSSPEARLRYYASVFPLTEVDSSYYAIPAPASAQLWAERTPDDFTFNIKAFRLFTGHQTSPLVLHRDIQAALAGSAALRSGGHFYYQSAPPEIRVELWRRYREAIEPLASAGKLGAVHFQFPPWVLPDARGQAHVRHCVEQMQGHTVSVEFRHRSWWEADRLASTLAFERELGVVHTVVDAPQGFDNSVPPIWTATHPKLALVRLHGRNAATWNIKGSIASSSRFDYDYPEAELVSIADEIARLARLAESTHVVFNNNNEDQSQRNGRTLMAIGKGAWG